MTDPKDARIKELEAEVERLESEARLHNTIVTQLQRGHKAYVDSIEASLREAWQ